METCLTCPADTYSTLGSAACEACAANEFSAPASDSIARCLCVAGFFRPAGFDGAPEHERPACAQCPYGTFRNVTHAQHWGSLACQACPEGTSTAATGATSVAACSICPAGSFIVDAGHLEGACVPCGANALSIAGTRGGCVCAAGFEPGAGADAALCVACTYGHHKLLRGNHSCTACAAGKQGVLALGAAALGEAAACELCPADTHWAGVGTPCTPCHENSEAAPGAASAADCLCRPGHELRPHTGLDGIATMACSACSPGFAKAAASNAAFCAPCSGLLYSHGAASAVCQHCPAHSSGGHANDADVDCVCDAGFSGPDGGPCLACEVGKYKQQQGSASCLDCGPDAFWPPGADPTVFRCQPCPEHSTRGADLGSGVLGCVCNRGFQRTADDACAVCRAGSYCPEQHALLPCPPHSLSAPGAAALRDCLCIAGFHGAAGNCSVCPVDAFCPAAAAEPAPCPANSSTLGLAGRTNVSACVCLPGFYRATDAFGREACLLCERDSFCFDDRRLACPANSSAPPGADSVSDCACHDGTAFEPRAAAHVCTPCGPAQVCRGGVVTQCAAGALNANFRCVCAAGSFCAKLTALPAAADTDPKTCLSACHACPDNHWCSDNALTACGAHEAAPANSSAPCRCLDGFYRSHLGACVECPLHHVCSNETRRPVAEFDPGLRTLAPRRAFLSQAVCAPGLFRSSKTDLCKLCPMGFYCPPESPSDAASVVALPNVVRCPANEFTVARGASSRTQCACAVGFKIAEHEATAKCLPCAVGERCQGGSVLEVECHLENKAINADHSACVCEAGFGLLDFECQECPHGFVKPVIGDTPCVPCGIDEYAVNNSVCMPCPPYSEARPGSAVCTCAPPYALRDGACALCPADHFWTPAGCAACPPESSSQPAPTMVLGAGACRCAPGHHTTPASIAGVLRCEVCPAGTFERRGACLPCPQGSWAPPKSHAVEACVCNALPGANSTCHALRIDGSCAGVCASTPPACAACAAGHYKSTPSTPGNTERCLACAEGQYQPAAAALSCETCPQHEWHTALAATTRTQCLCAAGWTRLAGNASKEPCAACSAGYYKDWLGDETCAPCAVGRYNPHLNATYCHFCRDASLELLLAAGSARPVLESNATAQQASVSILACVCERGHEPRQGSSAPHCSPCAPGTFKEHRDHELCAFCGALNADRGTALLHHFGATATGAVSHSHCRECPLFSGQDVHAVGPGLLVMDELDDCKCFPGHDNRSALGCGVCPPYMVQPAYSDDACSFCAPGHYFVDRHVPCQACYIADDGGSGHELIVLNRNDASLSWGVDAGDCICRLGYERDATDICRACPAGKFRGSNGTRWCSECAANTYQFLPAAQTCLSCPPNSSTLLATGQPAVERCVCGAGFQPLQHVPSAPTTQTMLCLPCAAGTYRQRRLANESQEACLLCPADHYCPAGAVLPSPCPHGELALPGSTDIDHCLCPSGSGRLPGPAHAPHELSNPCILCAHAFFAPTNGNTPCTPCPANKNTSAPGATALAHCTCVPGHGVAHSTQHASHDAFLAAACAPCADGFFAPGGRSAPCTHCGWGAVTEPAEAASAASSCQCNSLVGLFSLRAQAS
jgi:hypothetical protein